MNRPAHPIECDDSVQPGAELKTYHLDPDFRTDPKDWKKPFCARCQKNLDLGKQKAVKISVDWDSHQCWEDAEGESWLGPDCKKAIGM